MEQKRDEVLWKSFEAQRIVTAKRSVVWWRNSSEWLRNSIVMRCDGNATKSIVKGKNCIVVLRKRRAMCSVVMEGCGMVEEQICNAPHIFV